MAKDCRPLLIKNGKLIDGAGNPWFYADILVENGTISKIGTDLGGFASKATNPDVIDAQGRFVTPGFIDIHGHSDLPLFVDGEAQSFVRQGVTTQIVGNCGGWSTPLYGQTRLNAEEEAKGYGYFGSLPWSDVKGYRKTLSDKGVSINVGILVGHGAIRAAVLGFEDRDLGEAEEKQCERYLQEAMDQGAFGMSLGLYYAPGSYAKEDEIVKLSKVVHRNGGIVSVHMRDESDYGLGLLASIDEVIRISKTSGAKYEISHLKCLGARLWGMSSTVIEKIGSARQKGVDITADQYPYTASSSSITGALIPRWAQSGSGNDMVARLKDAQTRDKIKTSVFENLERRGGPERLLVSIFPPNPKFNGLTLADVAAHFGCDPAETALRLLEKWDAPLVSFVMDEDDVRNIMKSPFVMVASDGWALSKDGPLSHGHPHPRSFGTFPRVLSKYALKEGVLSLEDAVRKMTSFPAARLGLQDRGLLKVGAKADIVVLNPDALKDKATFENPKQYPEGVDEVVVNGGRVVEKGEHTGKRPGALLKRHP